MPDATNDIAPSGASPPAAAPRPCLSTFDAVTVIVGIVIGAGIFEMPAWVAGNVTSTGMLMGVWVAGGIISLIGALCYAELASAYPDAGGDYHFLGRAYGPNVAFLFAWARMTVIQTGSIAALAFIIGDYATAAIPFGAYSAAIYAALVVVLITGINVMGVRTGAMAQNLSTAAVVLGLLMVVVAGFTSPAAARMTPASVVDNAQPVHSSIALAMVFVLFTYGGWNEAAYLSAEIRTRRGIVAALLIGIAVITVIYLLTNAAMLHALGLSGMANSKAVAAEIMRNRFGDAGAYLASAAVIFAALSTANATAITGARSNYALGRDFPLLRALGRWQARRSTPVTALLLQGAIALALVLFGSMTRSGLKAMVDYITPVFWGFFLLAGASVIVLRYREPEVLRPFRVPLYPVTPLLFCAVCAYMLQSQVVYNGQGSLVGLAVLLAGVPLLLLARTNRLVHQPSRQIET
ncbi:MAG: amino acid permease [Tepidisphaeraceae bacterium]